MKKLSKLIRIGNRKLIAQKKIKIESMVSGAGFVAQ